MIPFKGLTTVKSSSVSFASGIVYCDGE